MQNEKTQTMPQFWFTENMRAMYNDDDDDDNDNDDDQPQNCTADYGKIKIIGTAAIFFITSDVKAVAPDVSLCLSLTDALSTALSYLSDTLTLFLLTIAGEKHGVTNTVHESTGFAPFTVFWPCNSNTPSLWYKIFTRLTAWAPILQLLQGGAEIWVQFCSCKALTYHKISSINLLPTMLTTTWWH